MTTRLGRGFRLLFTASAISAIGDGALVAGVPLLAVTATRDPLWIAMAVTAGRLPWLVFGPLGGMIADKWDRKRLMVSMDVARAVLLLALVMVAVGSHARIVAIAAAVFLVGCATTVFDSAGQAAIPSLLSSNKAALHHANALLSGALLLGLQVVGPAMGGVLFATSARLPLVADAATFVVSAVLIAAIPRWTAPQKPRMGRWTTEITAGLRWVYRHRLLRTVSLLGAATNLATFCGQATLVLLVAARWHLSAATYGLLVTAAATGGVVATFTAGRLANRLGTAYAIRGAAAVIAAGAAAVALSSSLVVCIIGLAAISFGIIASNVPAVSLRQLLTPDQLQGRVTAATRMVARGTIPVGAAMGGVAMRWVGPSGPYLVATGILVACAVVAYVVVSPAAVAAAEASGHVGTTDTATAQAATPAGKEPVPPVPDPA